jgi:hypothetical protein
MIKDDKDIIDNKILVVTARIILPTLTLIALSIGGFMFNRLYSQWDEMNKQIISVNMMQIEMKANVSGTMETFRQFIEIITKRRDEEMKRLNEVIMDHELRLRRCEQGGCYINGR